jgi:GT2 family glycosyltransferase
VYPSRRVTVVSMHIDPPAGAASFGAVTGSVPGDQPLVATIVLNWNGRDDTLACLDALAASSWPAARTILVDNGSSDGTAEAVRERFPDVELIVNERNLGFAEGNNVGLRRAQELGADYAFLLNNDTVVDQEAIRILVEEAEARPAAGALSPLLFFAEPDDLVWYAGAEWNPDRGHNPPHEGYRQPAAAGLSEPRRVSRASGAAMLVRREVLERVGLLDTDLFLHVEDVEWSLRIQRGGYEIWFVPASRIWHKVSADSGGEDSPTVAYYRARNMLEVGDRYARHGPPRSIVRHGETLLAELLHARHARRPLENVRAAIAGWRDYRRGLLGPRDALSARGVRASGGGSR